MTSDDDLVAQYLARLDAAASGMPSDRRRELIDEITAHIAEARAADSPPPGGIRAVFDQLGSPEDIVRAAGSAPGGASYLRSTNRLGPMEIIAVIALLIGGVVVPFVGWVVGVVLLWMSPRWRTRDKLIGTLVWPGGLLVPTLVMFVVGAGTFLAAGTCESAGVGLTSTGLTAGLSASCTTQFIAPWLAITIAIVSLLVGLGGPIFAAIWLIRKARSPEMIAHVGNDLLAPTFSA